jgi:hypothetical protein
MQRWTQVASGYIAETVGAGKSFETQEEAGKMSDKTGWKGRGQQLWDLGSPQHPVPEPEPKQRKNSGLDSCAEYIVCGCWELEWNVR